MKQILHDMGNSAFASCIDSDQFLCSEVAPIYGFVRIFVLLVSFHFVNFFLSKRPSLWLLDSLLQRVNMENDIRWKTTFDGRQPSMKDDHRWKTTFDGGWPLMEDDLRWKTNFDGRQPSMEDNLRWKTTFDGRGPSMEDDFNGRWLSMDDDLRWKTIFNERWPSMEDRIYRGRMS